MAFPWLFFLVLNKNIPVEYGKNLAGKMSVGLCHAIKPMAQLVNVKISKKKKIIVNGIRS